MFFSNINQVMCSAVVAFVATLHPITLLKVPAGYKKERYMGHNILYRANVLMACYRTLKRLLSCFSTV